jgi:16S rRNA (uracil1498-N3)-methyltransferase
MRITRIFTGQELSPGQQLSLEPTAARHLVQVLRLRPGAELVLFNGDGHEYPARLESASKRGVDAMVLSRSGPEPESILDIHLCISVSRGERMDYAIQKAVELGVNAITPLFSKRGVVSLKGERLEKRQQHWRQVMISACEQSGRCRLPQLHASVELEELLASPVAGLGLVLNHRAENCIADLAPGGRQITILIGPEGGLGEGEIQAAANSGFHGVRLGPRVMRTETAPLAAIAALQTLWGDFK